LKNLLSVRSTVIALLALVALVWAGGSFWKDKPYQQWTDEDIYRLFTDSPWAHTVTIERTWVPWVNKELPEGPINGRGRGLPGSMEQSTDQARGAQARFYVLWMSSLVMRKALARRAVLHYQKNATEEDQTLKQQPDEYFVVVQGTDMTPFHDKNEEYYRANAFLQTKTTKQKISPSQVTYVMSLDGKSVYAAKFLFPKKTSSGELVIASNEKSLQFICRFEGSPLRADFDPQKMVDEEGPDL
jgi:hypothetical protein